MKSLLEYSQENILPIQHIFELSDDLLKRAAAAARERGSAIEKRRAREFEEWMNNPERKKIQELSGKSKYYKDSKEASEKYLMPAISAYENHDANKTRNLLKDFYGAMQNILKSIETSNVKIIINDPKWYAYHKPSKNTRKLFGSGSYLSEETFSFKPHWKKGDNSIFELGAGIKFKIKIKNIEEQVLKNLGYNAYSSGELALNVFKDGSISARVLLDQRSFLPSDFENDAQELLNIFNDSGFICRETVKNMLGTKSSKDTISVGDFFMHLDSSEDFTRYDLSDGLPRLINKIKKFFKTMDPSSKMTWTNKDEYDEGGWFAFTAKLDLTYKGNLIKLEVSWRDNYVHTKANIKANGEEIFNLDYTTTHWDTGCFTNNHSQKVSKKINNIFN